MAGQHYFLRQILQRGHQRGFQRQLRLQRVQLLPPGFRRTDQRRKVHDHRQQVDCRHDGQRGLQVLPGTPQVGHQGLLAFGTSGFGLAFGSGFDFTSVVDDTDVGGVDFDCLAGAGSGI